MSNLLRRTTIPRDKIDISSEKYKIFNLKQNPFPVNPGVTIGGDDKRENGSIYLKELRTREENTFENLLIPKPAQAEPKRICFLMDFATRQGRGIGKTAFLNYQRKRIMDDLGDSLTEG